MRVAHITDLHIERAPRVDQLFSKRALGAVNLYVLGRKAHFSEATTRGLVSALMDDPPDLVVCTGDLTATATEEEFLAAREVLAPVLDGLPFVVLPGNHDVYTGDGRARFEVHFGAWANGGVFPFVRRAGGWDLVLFDVVRPDWLSRGRAGKEALASLDALLAAGSSPAMLLLHYPLRDRHGAPYGPSTRALEGAAALEEVLARHPRVKAVLHGHEHHGFRTVLPTGQQVLDPGASGYAHLPAKRRTAHYNVYTLDDDAIVGIERHAWDGSRFLPEPGGAYATGG